MMSGFHIKNNTLHVDQIAFSDIAKEHGTPTYIYSAAIIRDQYQALSSVMRDVLPDNRQPMICYACKANSNISILNVLKNMGCGLEIVSEGELFRGLKAGFDPAKIISTSFGKGRAEIIACITAGIRQFNIEAADEVDHINDISKEMGKTTQIVFRLNPNIAGGGHDKISTGRKEDKFGNSAEDIIKLYQKASELTHVNPIGLSVHIGSQVSTIESFRPAFEKLTELVKILRAAGHMVTCLDIGGGFPIIYNDEKLLDLRAYAEWVRDIIVPLETEIQMEPGRYLVGNAGVLLTKVEYVKQTPSRNFLVLDAGMNDLIRPTLYDAYHDIQPVTANTIDTDTYDIVGPICESGDIFTKGRTLTKMAKDDLVAIKSAGAYGFSMASTYNSRPLPSEILIDGNHASVIRKRQTLEDLIQGEAIPA